MGILVMTVVVYECGSHQQVSNQPYGAIQKLIEPTFHDRSNANSRSMSEALSAIHGSDRNPSFGRF